MDAIVHAVTRFLVAREHSHVSTVSGIGVVVILSAGIEGLAARTA